MKQNEQELARSFDRISDLYDTKTDTFHHQISSYVTMQNLQRELPESRDAEVLDSGGGTGKYSIFLKKLGYNITLTDISKKSIVEANRKAAKHNMQLSTVVCDSENTPFDNDRFAFVMMNGGVISYTPNPNKLIRETNRILKTNGVFWFDFLNSLGWAMETVDPKFKAELALENDRLIKMSDWDYPARLMSLEEIERLLKDNGFRIKSQYGLVLLSNSLPLQTRYSTDYDQELVEKYKTIELALSRRPECIGSSWSCAICAIKE